MKECKLPFVTIVIPVKPGLTPDAIKAIKKINYPKDKIEVITVYGRNPSKQRNEAVKLARGDIIYFLDNDSMPEKDTLMKLIVHIKDDVVLAGGPSIMPEKLPVKAFVFGKTLESFFSTGHSRARYRKIGDVRFTDEKEIILCNMVMKKDIFLEFGGFNERLYPNEENELMDKLKHSGFKMIYDPHATVIRMPRKTLISFIKQIFNYGRGRGEQTVFYPKSFNLFNFAPLIFLLYLLFSLFYGGYFFIPLIFYFVILILDCLIKIIKSKDIRYIFLPITTFILHITYGVGLVYGLLKAPFKKVKNGGLKIEYVKV